MRRCSARRMGPGRPADRGAAAAIAESMQPPPAAGAAGPAAGASAPLDPQVCARQLADMFAPPPHHHHRFGPGPLAPPPGR